jgi:hypothetical protein
MTSPLIRKVHTFVEDILVEGRKAVASPYRFVTTAAVMTNPWPTDRYEENLRPLILELTPTLVDLLIPRAVELAGGPDAVEAFGKAGLVGVEGEVEHAAAFIHTLRFGNELRKAVKADSFIPFSNTRGGPGMPLTIPLKHKVKASEGSRAHFLSTTIAIPDAPGPRELVVAVAVATSGRPHHRIGDRYQDMAEMGVDQTGAPLKG